MSYLQHRMGLLTSFARPGNYAPQAIESFTMDALNDVIAAIPDWLTRLDQLHGQIDTRQIELAALAALTEYRPPTRSLKPKGSTESLLRPNDDEKPVSQDHETDAVINKLPALTQDTIFPPSASAEDASSPTTPKSSPPQPLRRRPSTGPSPIQRRASQRLNSPSNAPKPTYPTVLRKRKTESVASGESVAPKYRTRSMIVVYYDSAVQLAFEELVKFISASRNAMRKGKMAARMADMKKVAELDVESSDEDEPPTPEKEAPDGAVKLHGDAARPTVRGAGGEKEGTGVMRLEFVSTRKMGPSRDSPEGVALRKQGKSSTERGSGPLLQAFRGQPGPTPAGSFTSIFDELDAGLEWSQSTCEHAAHQFLRDGTCSVEIEGVKARLAEVKQIAEREAARVAAAHSAAAEKLRSEESPKASISPEDSRGMKHIQMRKSFMPTLSKALDTDHIEVDEGFDEEVEDLPPLRWRSAGQLI